MAETPGPRPEIVNSQVNAAMAKAKAKPDPKAVWDVVRQLGQGGLTVVNTKPAAVQSSTDPSAIPGFLTTPEQAVLAIGSKQGPLLVAFTARNVSNMLPAGTPAELTEELRPAMEVAAIAGKAPYAGLAIDPGSENGYVIPAPFLSAGLPVGGTNFQAKAILETTGLAKPGADPKMRQALVAAVARGPIYTAVEKKAFEETGEYKFPLVPLSSNPELEEVPDSGAAAAVLFGTSPAEILAALGSDQYVPLAVQMNDVVKTLQNQANVKLIVLNPLGPSLQLSATGQSPDTSQSQVAHSSGNEDLLHEPTPEVGEATEPDGGTREGED